MIHDHLRSPDVFISTDPLMNTNVLMGPKNGNLVKWFTIVASSQLVLAYNPHIGQPLDAKNISLTNNLAGIVLAQLFVGAPFVIVSRFPVSPVLIRNWNSLRPLWAIRDGVFFVAFLFPWHGRVLQAGLTLAWIRAIGEFGSTLIVAYNPHSLPVYMWVEFESDGLTGALPAAFCLVMLAATAVVMSMLFSRVTGFADVDTPFGKAAMVERY